MDKVSVVMACHNAKSYLEAAVRSVLAQSYTNIELVVVDDASTDGTFELAATFLRDARFKLIRCPVNGGVSAARNRGIHAATGAFVAFIDADDMWEPSKLAAQMTVMATGADITWTSSTIIDDAGIERSRERSSLGFNRRDLLKDCFFRTSSVLLRRRPNIRFDETLRVAEDYELWIRLLLEGAEGSATDGYLTRYRVTDGSLSSSPIKQALGRARVYLKHLGPTPAAMYYFACYACAAVAKRFRRRRWPAL